MHVIEIIKVYLGHLTHWMDFISIAIILWGFLIAFKDILKYEFSKINGKSSFHQTHVIRVKLGTYILLGLEFMIASDITHTFISHTFQDLSYLSLIVIIRTTISFFLGREIAEGIGGKKGEK
jgi:uncharacterized membrane protein